MLLHDHRSYVCCYVIGMLKTLPRLKLQLSLFLSSDKLWILSSDRADSNSVSQRCLVRQTLTLRIKVDCGNCIIFNIQSIIYKVTRYINIITNTRNYKYLNVINIAYFCALINQNNPPNRLARCLHTENLSFKSSNRGMQNCTSNCKQCQ